MYSVFIICYGHPDVDLENQRQRVDAQAGRPKLQRTAGGTPLLHGILRGLWQPRELSILFILLLLPLHC